jgi:hypothetical protein
MKTALLLAFLLAGCGGGSLTAEEIAQHDADMQAMKTIQPVVCDSTTENCK